MDKTLNSISELLPEGLTESTVKEIFSLMDTVIKEEVAKKTRLLEAKVFSFIRTKVDELKEHALAELSEENEIFRNARLFENVRSLMSLELNSKDETNSLTQVSQDNDNLKEELDVLTQQLNNVLLENDKMKSKVKVLIEKATHSENKVTKLVAKRDALQEEVSNLKADKEIPFESSERAFVFEAKKEIPTQRTVTSNPFLTPEVLDLLK